VGSISHSESICFVAVARAAALSGLGVDAEGASPLEEGLYEFICRPDELHHFSRLPQLRESNWPKLTFSAKEAFYKYYHPQAGTFLEFGDVSVRFNCSRGCNGGSFQVSLQNPAKPRADLAQRAHGRWLLAEGHVFTLVTAASASE
jgi:4'-phosphopantetheinyl transferase EntD